MNDQVTAQLLLALVATQAPAPTDEWLRSQIPAFEPCPKPPNAEAWRVLRSLRDLGNVAEFERLRERHPDLAEEAESFELRRRAWAARYDEHNRAHGEAARFRWRAEWAGKLLAAVREWERKGWPPEPFVNP